MRDENRQLRWLKWLAVLGPVLFLAAIELLRTLAPADLLRAWPGYVLFAGVVLIAALFFAEAIFAAIGRMQQRLHRQNRELLALHDAGLAITSELHLERVLQRVVDEARELGAAEYGALSLLGDDGIIREFLTSGLSREERDQIGPIPTGHGLLAAVFQEGAPLRLPNLGDDPRSVGFPPHHPEMHSLLAVPVQSRGHVLGSLYLAERRDAPEFSEDDQRRLERFATQAAIAIENANLHFQVQSIAVAEERERIAREMHDTVAQVLGYVNTKAQAAEEHLRHGRIDPALVQLSGLSSSAREAYADLREAILGLRTTLGSDTTLIEALRAYLESWELQSSIRPSLTTCPLDLEHLDIDPLAELQVLRIIQESLSNVRKHAGATSVQVELRQDDDEVQIVISDDGRGFAQDRSESRDFPRFGLGTMRERAEAVNGRFTIESTPEAGTTVTVCIPRKSAMTTDSPR